MHSGGSQVGAPPRSEGFTDEEAERGFVAGNRWPRQETLALLKIRSDMDAAFRDATLKGPLWEEVSRQLAEMGYQRCAKKCKEKFENVQKYYKRTKDGRTGRQDGKTYRFFSQLEALQNPPSTSSPPILSLPTSSPSPLNFNSDAFSSSASESEEEDDPKNCKRSKEQKMMAFFQGLMNQVMERQEKMQQRFLETIERREEERMMREEAWRRQEMARVQREKAILSQERAISASRDASIVAFLQKMTGHVIPEQAPALSPSPPPQDLAAPPSDMDPAAARWPKAEVHALIQLRIGLEAKYQEAGPKGPLWEEIASGMKKIGYNRTPKRCKEKWENINKYFKKVKESNKRRPEDSKTCPYFHQLEALYRKKLGKGGGAAAPPAEETGAAAAAVDCNGQLSPSFFHENGDVGTLKKAMENYEKLHGRDMDVDPDEDEDDPHRKMGYVAQYQERTGVNGTSDCGTSSSFMAMVQ